MSEAIYFILILAVAIGSFLLGACFGIFFVWSESIRSPYEFKIYMEKEDE
jgi:hypothetical protein